MPNEPTTADLFRAAVGERVLTWRLALGMTRKELARSAGLSVGYVARLERGLANPTVTTIQAMAAALETTVAGLLDVGGDELGIAAAAKASDA